MGKDKWGKLNIGSDHLPCIIIRRCLVLRGISQSGLEASTVEFLLEQIKVVLLELQTALTKLVFRRAVYQQHLHAGWEPMFNACQCNGFRTNIGLKSAWHLPGIRANFMLTVQFSHSFSPNSDLDLMEELDWGNSGFTPRERGKYSL